MTRKPAAAKPALPFRKLVIELEEATYEHWLANAQRRQLTMADFTSTIIETICRDDLIPEILGETESAE